MKISITLWRRVILTAGLLCLSTLSNATTVWLVQSGAASGSNTPGTALDVAPLAGGSYDLYMDLEGDTAYGWDIDLDVSGSGSISSVSGPALGLGTSLPNGGWAQIGGDVFGESGVVLLMSFDFSGDLGASIALSGTYTDASFLDANFPNTTLLNVSNVPLPAASWLFLSALGGLVLRRTR